MTWHNPEAFFLIYLGLLALTFLYFVFKKARGSLSYSALEIFKNLSQGLRVRLLFLPSFLKWVALVFLILALARPQLITDRSSQSQKGLDIMLVMDISLSMLVADMSGLSRLQASKEVVTEFVKGRAFDRMGLILFSGESFTKVPLTFDHGLLNQALSEVRPMEELKEGTAIGVALANAVSRLKSSPKASRLIIFLTDGDNNAGFIDPDTALHLTKKSGIKVYSIGLGKHEGNSYINQPVKLPGGKTAVKKLLITSGVNTELLEKISKETGGRFFYATDGDTLKSIFKTIDKQETYEIEVNEWTEYTELFEKFTLASFIFYLLSLFLSLTIFFKGI